MSVPIWKAKLLIYNLSGPANDAIEPVTFDIGPWVKSPYIGEPRPELDEACHDLLKSRYHQTSLCLVADIADEDKIRICEYLQKHCAWSTEPLFRSGLAVAISASSSFSMRYIALYVVSENLNKALE